MSNVDAKAWCERFFAQDREAQVMSIIEDPSCLDVLKRRIAELEAPRPWQEVAKERMAEAKKMQRLHFASYALELLDLIGESGPVDGDALRARLRSALEGVQIHRCGKADMGPGGELP